MTLKTEFVKDNKSQRVIRTHSKNIRFNIDFSKEWTAMTISTEDAKNRCNIQKK
jgi:hypothetical protein